MLKSIFLKGPHCPLSCSLSLVSVMVTWNHIKHEYLLAVWLYSESASHPSNIQYVPAGYVVLQRVWCTHAFNIYLQAMLHYSKSGVRMHSVCTSLQITLQYSESCVRLHSVCTCSPRCITVSLAYACIQYVATSLSIPPSLSLSLAWAIPASVSPYNWKFLDGEKMLLHQLAPIYMASGVFDTSKLCAYVPLIP